LVDLGGHYTTIDVAGSIDTVVEAINALGQIAGHYVDSSGHQHGFLATPEPAPVALTGVTASELRSFV
jgi:hypothetical protein